MDVFYQVNNIMIMISFHDYIMISLLQENTKYFNVVANLQEKTLDTFSTVSKSINDSNINVSENNKTFTESINNLPFEITATNKR